MARSNPGSSPAGGEGGREPLARPKRSLGQNFLVDDNVARKIAALVETAPGDKVLEIGPGRGALTRFLIKAGPGSFWAVEKDVDLALGIKARWPEARVVAADALRFPWERLDGFKVAGNLPYNVASPIIWELVSRGRGVTRLVCMVQKEVGQRLAARPGAGDYGALSAWVQSFAAVRLAFTVPPTVFRPRPKVDSAVMVISPRPVRGFQPVALAGLIKRCFQQRRKQVRNLLRNEWSLELENFLVSQGLGPASRPEEFSPEVFQALSILLQAAFPA